MLVACVVLLYLQDDSELKISKQDEEMMMRVKTYSSAGYQYLSCLLALGGLCVLLITDVGEERKEKKKGREREVNMGRLAISVLAARE